MQGRGPPGASLVSRPGKQESGAGRGAEEIGLGIPPGLALSAGWFAELK